MKQMLEGFRLFGIFMGILDFLCFEIALVSGYLLWINLPWPGHWQSFEEFSLLMWILPVLGVIVFKMIGLYKPEMGVIGVEEQSLIFKGTWIIYFLTFSLAFFYREASFSRLATLYSMMIAMVLISAERHVIRLFYSWLNQKGIANRKAVIVGAGFNGVRLERWIRQSPQLGLQVVGYIDDAIDDLQKKPEFPKVYSGIDSLSGLIADKSVAVVFVAHRQLSEEKIIKIIQTCRELGVRCWVIPSLFRFNVEHVELQNIGGIPLLGFREQVTWRAYEFIKHLVDRVVALFLLLISAPLWITVGLGIFFTSGTPIFFKQVRVGKKRKKFTIYKFRTMKKLRKDIVSPELQKDETTIISPFSGFLRRTGLDEIPQLFNVLKGDMSLVGPRPEMPFLVDKYGPLEKERLLVKPGITGLWQISDDRKRLLIHENMDYDLYYLEHFSFNLDLAILVKTFFVLVKRVFYMKERRSGQERRSIGGDRRSGHDRREVDLGHDPERRKSAGDRRSGRDRRKSKSYPARGKH